MSEKKKKAVGRDLQMQNIRKMLLHRPVRKQVDAYANTHGMSRSEALRLIMRLYTEDRRLETRDRGAERVTAWIPPEEYDPFMSKVRRKKTTISAAIESVLREHL